MAAPRCTTRFFRPLGPAFSLRRNLLPAPATLAAFAAAAAVATASNWLLLAGPAAAAAAATGGGAALPLPLPQRLFMRRGAAHVAVGVVLLAGLVGLMARTERATLRQVLEMRRQRQAPRGGDRKAEGSGGAMQGGEGGKEE